MKKTFATLIVAAGLTFGAASTASADAKAGGVTVDENATAINGLNRQIATAEDKIAIAIGNRVIAENAQATVYEHTAINGDNRQTARAGNMIAVSIGNRAYARNSQATVYDDVAIGGSNLQTASAQNQFSLAIGSGSSAETHIASILKGSKLTTVRLEGHANSLRAMAIGQNSSAKVMLGTVKSGKFGATRLSGTAQQVYALSVGPNSNTCIAIGSAQGRGTNIRRHAAVGSVFVADLGFRARTRVNIGTYGKPC